MGMTMGGSKAVREAYTLLEIINNKELFQERLDQFTAAEAAATQAQAAAAKEREELKADADEVMQQAEAARAEAADVLAKATARERELETRSASLDARQRLQDKRQTDQDNRDAELAKRQVDLTENTKAAEKTLSERAIAVNEQYNLNAEEKKRVAQLRADAETLKADYEQRLAAIKALVS